MPFNFVRFNHGVHIFLTDLVALSLDHNTDLRLDTAFANQEFYFYKNALIRFYDSF